MRQGTYSIVARDPETGELGVAVQSHWFSVGSVVAWAQPGVGAVATQALAEISYGPRVLELLRAGAGMGAHDALTQILADDPGASLRQVAVVDASGSVAIHTGADCIAFAGHTTGEQVSCQANIMVSERVWPAMLAAYQDASGPLAHRLLAALDAAEASAATRAAASRRRFWSSPRRARGGGGRWISASRITREPLAELRRLLGVHDAYSLAEQAEALDADGDHDAAIELRQREPRALAGQP